MTRGFRIDEPVSWQHPLTGSLQIARVLDVAGRWVLVRNDSGIRAGEKAWVHEGNVKHFDFEVEEKVYRDLQQSREQACRRVHSERRGLAGVCCVCYGPLHPIHTLQGSDRPRYDLSKTWLHCPACDRLQRQEVPA